MAREGFLTYLENYYKKHDIKLEQVEFELKKLDKSFSTAVETIIAEKINPDVSILRSKGFIKVDENNNLYIELESKANIRVIITNNYLKNKKAIFVTEDDFEKTAMAMDHITYEHAKNRLGLGKYLKDFKDLPCAANLIKEDFKKVANEARKLNKANQKLEESRKEKRLMESIEEIYFIDPDVSQNIKENNNKDIGTSIVKHDDISLYKRHELMMNLEPSKTIRAKGLTINSSSYLSCLYNIGKNEDNMDLYVLVMEPNTSYGYTKTAYFKTDKEITEEDFRNKTAEYLQYPSYVWTSLANTTRFCHKTIDSFENVLDALVFDEYKSFAHKNKLQIAKSTAEEFHQGSTKR